MQRGVELVNTLFLFLEMEGELESYCKSMDNIYRFLETAPPIIWTDPTRLVTPTNYGSPNWSTIDRKWKKALKHLTRDRKTVISH